MKEKTQEHPITLTQSEVFIARKQSNTVLLLHKMLSCLLKSDRVGFIWDADMDGVAQRGS